MSSKIDQVFQTVFGNKPNNKGEALELFAAIIQASSTEFPVQHNEKMTGTYSETDYQIDTKTTNNDGVVIGEAKDYSYSDKSKKVGRDDIQKLVGAMQDLTDVSEAKFYTSTEYTKPARNYADASPHIGKPISLNIIHPTTDDDLANYINSVKVEILYQSCATHEALFTPHFTEASSLMLQNLYKSKNLKVTLDAFYNQEGDKILSLAELTKNGYPSYNAVSQRAQGCFLLAKHFISYEKNLFELQGLEYDVPIKTEKFILDIADTNTPCLTLKNAEGSIIRFYSEEALRPYKNKIQRIFNNKHLRP